MRNKLLLSLICTLVVLASTGCVKKDIELIELDNLRDEEVSYTDSISEMDYYVEKTDQHNDIKFNEYYKGETRKIFLASNITDIIITKGEQKLNLNKLLLSDTKMSDYDVIHFMMRKLDKKGTLKDGGTTIYKDKNKDVTMIVCNTLDKNYDVYIGDKTIEYEQFMCS